MEFKKRSLAPSKTTEYFGNKNPYSGTNYDMFKKHPEKLGNCTHYAYSRFSEILGKECKLPSGNAGTWYDKVTNYNKGKEPKLGSVIEWKHTKKSGGHVGIVEEIKSNGDLIVSMSGWNSGLFWTRTVTKSSGYVYNDYKLNGFIYSGASEKTKKSYSGKYPTLPKRGYFKKGDKGVNAKLLQELLNWINDDKLSTDGIIGDKTISSVKKFQTKVGITSDGLFGKSSLEKAKGFKK